MACPRSELNESELQLLGGPCINRLMLFDDNVEWNTNAHFTARCYASAVYAVALCTSFGLSHVLQKRLNTESGKQRRTIAQGL